MRGVPGVGAVPEGVWSNGALVVLPPPGQEEVEAVLARVVKQVSRAFEAEDSCWPEDGFEKLQAEGAQLRLTLTDVPERERSRRRVAVGQGFSLHADTWVHGNDREGLARLCRYGARGPIAGSRLSQQEDGRYAYQTKKGVTLVLTAEQLMKRLLWLIPPARMHLTSFHGVFASHAKERARVTPQGDAVEEKVAPSSQTAAKSKAPAKPKRPRLDWATLQQRTFGADVWACPCGGRRRVLAVVTSRRVAEEVLRNMRLLAPRPLSPVAQAPPQFELSM
jgi:hypothetical protein